MKEIQFIEAALAEASRRRRCDNALQGLWRGLLAGSVVWLVGLLTFKLLPVPVVSLVVAGAAGALCAIIGLLAGFWRRPTLLQTARWVDEKRNLKERLSTALESSAGRASGDWRELVVHDAAAHLSEIKPRDLLPFHLPRATRWALLTLAVTAGLGFIPEYRSKAYLDAQREAAIIKETGKQLAGLTQRSLDARKPALEPTQKALQSVKELGERLDQANLTRAEALRDVAKVTEKLKDQARELAKDPGIRRLEQAARSAESQRMATANELQKKIDELKKDLGEKIENAAALEKLKNELQNLEKAAAGAADRNASADSMKEQFQQSLARLSQRAQESGLDAASLEAALAALQQGDIDKFLKELKDSQVNLDKMLALAKFMDQLKAELAQMGKNLAEQLEKGQGDAAVETLNKMIEALKSANLNQEQLARLMKEVNDAVKPGSQYGKVGEFLARAGEKMGQGQKGEGAQALADARNELEKLMEQAGDMAGMLEAMKNLDTASLCLGSCQGWGQCRSLIPKVGKGGKPGRGVGTWADEDGGWLASYIERDELWDNSGLDRPDMEGKGITDRGDGELPDTLIPDKIKGQISPGGQMPNITLRGVSIRGQSKVTVEEAITAAQSDAQSALSQEKIPRAYQQTVKGYFDDLKQ